MLLASGFMYGGIIGSSEVQLICILFIKQYGCVLIGRNRPVACRNVGQFIRTDVRYASTVDRVNFLYRNLAACNKNKPGKNNGQNSCEPLTDVGGNCGQMSCDFQGSALS